MPTNIENNIENNIESSLPFFTDYRTAVDLALDHAIQTLSLEDSVLSRAMAYSTILGGKRIRPILVLSTAECFGVHQTNAMPAACAVEFIHAYSLIHDDLPAMDDDDLRRGQATCHMAFDEATAILAGDALQALAFEILALSNTALTPESRLAMIQTLAKASGARGMIAGQSIDLQAVGQTLTLDALERMHAYKTGALIEASVQLGALCSPDSNEQERLSLQHYARTIGLAFQVQDDILDITSNTSVLGKQQGADEALNKPTYPALLGLDGARLKLQELHHNALELLETLQYRDTTKLQRIADFIVERVR